MALYYRVDTELKVVFSLCRETIAESDVAQHLATVAQHSTFSPAYSHLIDCSEITSLEISPAFIRTIAAGKWFSSRARCAIVAPQDYIFGTVRMFQIQHRGALEVFRDLHVARTWLGIGEANLPAPAMPNTCAALHKSV